MKFNIQDMEKIILAIAFLITTLVTNYMFISTKSADYNMIGFSIGLASIFVARKGLSYFKKDSYNLTYQNETPFPTSTEQTQIQTQSVDTKY